MVSVGMLVRMCGDTVFVWNDEWRGVVSWTGCLLRSTPSDGDVFSDFGKGAGGNVDTDGTKDTSDKVGEEFG